MFYIISTAAEKATATSSPLGITDSKKELNQKLKCKAISLVHR